MDAQLKTATKAMDAGAPCYPSVVTGILQRKCACGAAPGVSGECEECQEQHLQRKAAFGSQPKWAISEPGDALEREAERVAESVIDGGSVAPSSFKSSPVLQRQTPNEPGRLLPDAKWPPEPGPAEEEKYKEAAKKIGAALRATKAGKELEAQAKQLGAQFLDSVEGKVIAGTAVAGALAAALATNADLPDLPIPEIPLDFIAPGLKAKLTWQGPAREPKNASLTLTAKSGVSLAAEYKRTEGKEGKPGEERAGLTLTVPFGGSSAKKPAASESEKYRAETARMQAENAKFREGLKNPAERDQDAVFWDRYWKSKMRDPLNPLAIRPREESTAKKEKKDEETLSRKESYAGASPIGVPPTVGEVLSSPGQPLDGATRGFFEPRFGHDFRHVRIHSDTRAADSARSVAALAYTVGRDIVFAADQFQPHSHSGKQLLAHELTHVLQQSGGLHRACDKALVGARAVPVFFPKQIKLKDVFDGAATLKKGDSDKEAVGLVQQALADLCHAGGVSGPNKDGVDRVFLGDTEKAVKAFQTAEGLTDSGEVDKETLRCLDEARSKRIVPCKTNIALLEKDLVVGFERTGGRDEEIFFQRGDKTLDPGDEKKIQKLAVKHKGKSLTLAGFESEDEVIDFGASLAKDRIDAVNAEFVSAGHGDPSLRKLDPKPAVSGGALDYRARRKVEIIPPGGAATTRNCQTIPSGWTQPDQGPCDVATDKIVKDAIDRGVKLMDDAVNALKPGDAAAEKAVADRFGDKKHLPAIKTKLDIWKTHLDTVVRANHICTNSCHGACEGTAAYTDGRGASSKTFLCDDVMRKPADADELTGQGLILVHEAGHGALGTKDVAYDSTRLLNVIHKDFSLAEINTDSFVLLIQCLNGVVINGMGCTVPKPGETFGLTITAAQQSAAEEALAWLERWMDFVWQDVNNLYPALVRARDAGKWLPDDAGSKATMDLLSKHLGLRRAEGSPAPTSREQTAVAAVHDRYLTMMRTTRKAVAREFVKDPAATPEWKESPKKQVAVKPVFFGLPSRRSQVRFLVQLVVEAQPDISSTMVPAYVEFTDQDSKTWFAKP
jgi:Domain of unknown function (DUF4157)/Putative peptidoglycan binding domain